MVVLRRDFKASACIFCSSFASRTHALANKQFSLRYLLQKPLLLCPPSPQMLAGIKWVFGEREIMILPHNHQRPALVLAGAITVAPQWCLLPWDKVRGMSGGREGGRLAAKRRAAAERRIGWSGGKMCVTGERLARPYLPPAAAATGSQMRRAGAAVSKRSLYQRHTGSPCQIQTQQEDTPGLH